MRLTGPRSKCLERQLRHLQPLLVVAALTNLHTLVGEGEEVLDSNALVAARANSITDRTVTAHAHHAVRTSAAHDSVMDLLRNLNEEVNDEE